MYVTLTPSEFLITRQNELGNKIQGLSLIFFYSNTCQYCKDVMPAFEKVSSVVQGCTFGLMNIDQDNRSILSMSNQTKTKITYVPYVVLYHKGNPVGVFEPDESNPQSNAEKLRNFLIKQADILRSNPQPSQSQISPSSIGIPGNKKRVCYATLETAYKNSSTRTK